MAAVLQSAGNFPPAGSGTRYTRQKQGRGDLSDELRCKWPKLVCSTFYSFFSNYIPVKKRVKEQCEDVCFYKREIKIVKLLQHHSRGRVCHVTNRVNFKVTNAYNFAEPL